MPVCAGLFKPAPPNLPPNLPPSLITVSTSWSFQDAGSVLWVFAVLAHKQGPVTSKKGEHLWTPRRNRRNSCAWFTKPPAAIGDNSQDMLKGKPPLEVRVLTPSHVWPNGLEKSPSKKRGTKRTRKVWPEPSVFGESGPPGWPPPAVLAASI